MDPVQQTLAQQTSGSAEGQGFGQYFVQGQQTSLSKRKLDLEAQQQIFDAQENHRKSMLFPLQQEAIRLHNENTGIEVAANREKWQAMTQQNALLPEIFKLQAAFAQSPQGYGDQNLINQAEELASKKPTAFAAGPGAELLTNIRAIPMMRQKFDEVRRFNKDLNGTGLEIQQFNPKTGNMEFMREQPGTAQPGQLSPIGKLITDMKAAQTRGDTESAETLKSAIQGQLQKEGFSITLPDGTQISQGGKTPVQSINKAEETATSAVNLVEMGNEIMGLASQGTTGVAGNLQRLGSQIGGQFGINVDAGQAFDYAQATALYKAAATKVLKSDSNISEKERQSIVNDLPNSTILESDASAKRKAAYATRKVAESARRQIQRANRPLPPQLMTKEEISKAVSDNKLSAQDAVEALKVTPFD